MRAPTRSTSLLFVFLSLLALTPVSSAAEPAPLPQGPGQELGDLKEEIDPSLRWLRGTQDAKTGAYGDGVMSSAWALRALAEGPRAYRAGDGFFVRGARDFLLSRQSPEGWIADADAVGGARRTQTQLAALALFTLLDNTTREAYTKALVWLTDAGLESPYHMLPTYEQETEAATRRALALLAKRQRDGSYAGEQGAVLATSYAAVELASYARLLKGGNKSYSQPSALPDYTPATPEQVDAAMQRGALFLLSVAEDGKWGAPGYADAGLTAIATGALQALPEPRPAPIQEAIDANLDWLASLQHEDGSIHQGRLYNYVTSAAVMALAKSEKPAHKAAVLAARDYLIDLQADEGEGYSEGDRYYGGIGYGGDERPDLSNMQMALEALDASGLDKDHEAYQRAIRFLERCQNRSESNDIRIQSGDVVIVAGDDGGAQYMPGDSKAGTLELADGSLVPRSYGSMTYALLKSFVFAGLEADDPRVLAAWNWLQANYTVDTNPGFDTSRDPRAGYQGLFYYYHSMARALQVFGAETITDADGKLHDWRAELGGRLLALQSKQDGSWVNANAPRWWEGNPVLASAYALLTLRATR
ncbi:MAG: squalene-hopene/tetraprenyl-beta-curcumene cyclase [Planctomycetota bacterium]|jgi:squalene-hopene/tetraprenyl-beta-curcumene cyclase